MGKWKRGLQALASETEVMRLRVMKWRWSPNQGETSADYPRDCGQHSYTLTSARLSYYWPPESLMDTSVLFCLFHMAPRDNQQPGTALDLGSGLQFPGDQDQQGRPWL